MQYVPYSPKHFLKDVDIFSPFWICFTCKYLDNSKSYSPPKINESCFFFHNLEGMYKKKWKKNVCQISLIFGAQFIAIGEKSSITIRVLASQSLLRPKTKIFCENVKKSHLGCFCPEPFNYKIKFIEAFNF